MNVKLIKLWVDLNVLFTKLVSTLLLFIKKNISQAFRVTEVRSIIVSDFNKYKLYTKLWNYSI